MIFTIFIIPSVFSIQRGRFEENRHSRVARMSDPSRFENLPEIMVVEFKEPESQTVGFWDSIWGTTEVGILRETTDSTTTEIPTTTSLPTTSMQLISENNCENWPYGTQFICQSINYFF